MGVRSFKDLVVWQKAMDLVVEIYRLTKMLPKEELYGLSSQIRRAVVSIPSNIAEGQGRKTDPEFAHFLRIAHGSLVESETQLLICGRLGYLDDASTQNASGLIAEVGRLIHGLLNHLK